MDRRHFLRKAGAAAAAAVTLPLGVHKLVEGMPPPDAQVLRAPIDPYAALGPPKKRWELGWKFQDPRTQQQYGAVLIADADVPIEVLGDFVARQMAETIVEVVGQRRALALAKSMA